jgi:hypothetical protein
VPRRVRIRRHRFPALRCSLQVPGLAVSQPGSLIPALLWRTGSFQSFAGALMDSGYYIDISISIST